MNEIKQEDSGIEHIHIYDENGHSISKSYTISSLINSPFTIQINQQTAFLFDPINKLQIQDRTIRQMKTHESTTDDTVATLYHALNIMKTYHAKYFELQHEADALQTQLEPLEKVKFN